MKRFRSACVGIVLTAIAEAILWNGPLWYSHEQSHTSPVFTLIIGIALIVQGMPVAFWAACNVGRAIASSTCVVRAGPIFLICGLLFWLAAVGPFRQASCASDGFQEAELQHVSFPPEAMVQLHKEITTERMFGILWIVVGGVLILTPLFCGIWMSQMTGCLNPINSRIVILGLAISGLGCLIWVGTAFLNKLSLVGLIIILAGAILSAGGCTLIGLRHRNL